MCLFVDCLDEVWKFLHTGFDVLGSSYSSRQWILSTDRRCLLKISKSWQVVCQQAYEFYGHCRQSGKRVILGASTAGQLALSLADKSTAFFFVLAATLYSLSLVPTAISSLRAPQPLLRIGFDFTNLWRKSKLVFLVNSWWEYRTRVSVR